MSSPLTSIRQNTVFQSTRWYSNSFPVPHYKKSLCKFSNQFATETGILKRQKISTSDQHYSPTIWQIQSFQYANLFSTFTIVAFYTFVPKTTRPKVHPSKRQVLHLPYIKTPLLSRPMTKTNKPISSKRSWCMLHLKPKNNFRTVGTF